MMRAASQRRSRSGVGHWLRRTQVLGIAASMLIGVTACGGSATKPAYCSARTNLENSIKGLTSLNLSSGISGLQAQLGKIESDANSLLSSAKSSFPSETSAIHTSVTALSSSVKSLSSSPSASEIATVAGDASKVVSSVKTFVDTTKSKCG